MDLGGVDKLPAIELPTISSEGTDESDSDLEEILFSGNTWSNETPVLDATYATGTVDTTGTPAGSHQQCVIDDDSSTRDGGLEKEDETHMGLDNPIDVIQPSSTALSVPLGAPALHCGLDDSELNALIARLHQGTIERTDSIGSRVFPELPPASELFSDEEDTHADTSNTLEGCTGATSGADLASPSRTKNMTFDHKGLCHPVQHPATVSNSAAGSLAPSVSLNTTPRPTMVLDLRASTDSSSTRAWPAMPEGVLSNRLHVAGASLCDDSNHSGTASEADDRCRGVSDSESDDGIEDEFNDWIRSRAELKAKYGSSTLASKAGSTQVATAANQAAVVARHVVRQDSMGSATPTPPSKPRNVTTKSAFVSTNFAAPDQGLPSIAASTIKSKADYDAATISTRNSASGALSVTDSDTQVVSDKSVEKQQAVQPASQLEIDTSEIQVIHTVSAGEAVACADSCTSPPSLTMSVLTDITQQTAKTNAACVIATDCDLDSWSADSPISTESVQLKISSCTSSDSFSRDAAPAEDQPLVQSPTHSAASSVEVLHAQMDLEQSVQNSFHMEASATHNLPLQMLPSISNADLNANFVIAAHVPQADICKLAATTEWLLQLQSDPFSTVPEFHVVSAVVVQAFAVSQQLGLSEEGAVVLLAASSATEGTASSCTEVLSELSSYLQNATDHHNHIVVCLPGWHLLEEVNNRSAEHAYTTVLDDSQELVITLAKGTAVLASADVLPTTLMRMARAGLQLQGLQTAYMDPPQCSALNRVSQLGAEAGSHCVFIAAVGPAGSVARWKAELGPTFGDVAAVTDPMSLHAELKDVCTTLTCSYDRVAAVKELEILWPTKVKVGSASPHQTERSFLLQAQLPPQSAWIRMLTPFLDDLITSLYTVQFLGAGGSSLLRLCHTGQQAHPSLHTSSPQLLLEVEAPTSVSTLEAISRQAGSKCPSLKLDVIRSNSDDPDQKTSPSTTLHQCCTELPPYYGGPDIATDIPLQANSQAGTVQFVGIAIHAVQQGAAAGCLASLLEQAQHRCPLLQALGVKLFKQLSAPVQQLFAICHAEEPTVRHVKGPALVAIVSGVDVCAALQDLTAGPTLSGACPADRMAFLNSSFFCCAQPLSCTIGITQNTKCALELMQKCFSESQLHLDSSLQSTGLLPEILITAGPGIYTSVSQLLQSHSTVCTLVDSTALQSQFDRLLNILEKDGFSIDQAVTVQLWPDLAQLLGCAQHDGERAMCIILSRPNAVQRLQHVLSTSRLDKCGVGACPTYHSARAAQDTLAASHSSSQGSTVDTTRPLQKGLMQTTCFFVAASSEAGCRWTSIGDAWREMHEDGFKLVGIATVGLQQVLKLQGISKLPVKDANLVQPVVALAVTRQNAISRCAMKLQDSGKAPSRYGGLEAIAQGTCCCMSSKSVAQAVSQIFPDGLL